MTNYRGHPWVMAFCSFFLSQKKMAFFCAVVIGPIAWAYFDSKIPVDYLDVQLETPDTKPGGFMVIKYKVVRHRICPAVITRLMLDSQGVIQEIAPVSFGRSYKPGDATQPVDKGVTERKVDEDEFIRVTVPVPLRMSPGPAQYQAVLVYYCSWIQERLNIGIQAVTPITNFNVLNEPEKEVYRPTGNQFQQSPMDVLRNRADKQKVLMPLPK